MSASDKLPGSPDHVKQACDFLQAEFLLNDEDFAQVNLTTVDIYGGTETLNRILNQLVSGPRTLPTGVQSNNWDLYNIRFVIHNNKIHNRPWGGGYTGDRYAGIGGSFTNRVQVGFEATGPTPSGRADTQEEIADPLPELTNAFDTLSGLAGFLGFLMDSKNWARVGAALFGGILIIVAFARMSGAGALILPPGMKLIKAAR